MQTSRMLSSFWHLVSLHLSRFGIRFLTCATHMLDESKFVNGEHIAVDNALTTYVRLEKLLDMDK